MKVKVTTDPSKVKVYDGYKKQDPITGEETWIEGECVILKDDVENAKAFAKELRKETNPRVIQAWEHDYYKQIKEQYSAQVAGAMLGLVWDWSQPEIKKEPEGQREELLLRAAEKILERIGYERR